MQQAFMMIGGKELKVDLKSSNHKKKKKVTVYGGRC